MTAKIIIISFLSLHLLIPLINPDLFPFSSFPMFSAKVPECTSLVNAKNSSGELKAIPILNKDWIYVANDKPILGCMVKETSNFVVKNGEDNNTLPLREILLSLKQNKTINSLELETFCPNKKFDNKFSKRSILIHSKNDL